MSYDDSKWYEAKIEDKRCYSHTEAVKEIEVPMPMLEKGEKFYFEDEDMFVTVVDYYRTDKDNIVYVVNNDRTIIDETSLRNAEELQNQHIAKVLKEKEELIKKNGERVCELIKTNYNLETKIKQYDKIMYAIENHWCYRFLKEKLKRIDFKG